VYTWLVSDGVRMEVGFLVDRLSALMMVVVTFVSLMVHVYTIGYMRDDPGYTRFFSYISLFTFAMLMLVMSNNLLQLFFGWRRWPRLVPADRLLVHAADGDRRQPQGVPRQPRGRLRLPARHRRHRLPHRIAALRRDLRAGDRIAATTFEIIPGEAWSAITVICICLFIGAMGKSAQVPLHVWLPDSMEGPRRSPR